MGLFEADLLRGPSLLLGMRSSRSPLLIESSVTWRRKLSSVQSRNLPKYLCPAVPPALFGVVEAYQED